jgi:hypothetical protein
MDILIGNISNRCVYFSGRFGGSNGRQQVYLMPTRSQWTNGFNRLHLVVSIGAPSSLTLNKAAFAHTIYLCVSYDS